MSKSAILSLSESTNTVYSEEETTVLIEDILKESMDSAVVFTTFLCNRLEPVNDSLSVYDSKMMILFVSKALFIYLLLRHLELLTPQAIFKNIETVVSERYKMEYENTVSIMESLAKGMNICHSKWFNPLLHMKNYLRADETGTVRGSPFKIIAKIINMNFYNEGSDYQDEIEEIEYEITKKLFARLESK